MGIGFPPWTGGCGAVHRGYEGAGGRGKEAFVARAKELAAKYGDRFKPPASLTSRESTQGPRNNGVSGAFASAHALDAA